MSQDDAAGATSPGAPPAPRGHSPPRRHVAFVVQRVADARRGCPARRRRRGRSAHRHRGLRWTRGGGSGAPRMPGKRTVKRVPPSPVEATSIVPGVGAAICGRCRARARGRSSAPACGRRCWRDGSNMTGTSPPGHRAGIAHFEHHGRPQAGRQTPTGDVPAAVRQRVADQDAHELRQPVTVPLSQEIPFPCQLHRECRGHTRARRPPSGRAPPDRQWSALREIRRPAGCG